MKCSRIRIAGVLTAGLIALTLVPMVGATGTTLWQNCTSVHTKYRHGVGRANAHDHTRSGTNPVTNFYRSSRLYNKAISYNRDLDRDRDGIACEQH